MRLNSLVDTYGRKIIIMNKYVGVLFWFEYCTNLVMQGTISIGLIDDKNGIHSLK